MENNYLRFSPDVAEKLSNDTFITIRPDDPKRFQVGELYDIYVGDERKFTAIMVKMTTVSDLKKLPLDIIKMDSNLNSNDEFINMMSKFYGDITNINWILLALRKIE